LSPAISVIGTVISRATPERAVIDCGHKALGRAGDGGMPSVVSHTSVKVNRLNSEHGILDVEKDARDICIGSRVSMIPRYHGSAVVAYDHFVGVRNGKVECVWDIGTRGSHQ
jgi:D-serine deaminase-like pyridoxal phosphate-dependent protein